MIEFDLLLLTIIGLLIVRIKWLETALRVARSHTLAHWSQRETWKARMIEAEDKLHGLFGLAVSPARRRLDLDLPLGDGLED